MRKGSSGAERPDLCNVFWRLDFEQSLQARRIESLRIFRDLLFFTKIMRKCANASADPMHKALPATQSDVRKAFVTTLINEAPQPAEINYVLSAPPMS